jgi:predicted Rossmann fold nucleotide-binding protein DprA/Smf involved in DNA uptake
MSLSISPNTQAILLLTAPLYVGKANSSAEILSSGEYNQLARFLREKQLQPAHLITHDADKLAKESQNIIPYERLMGLLGRGFQLGQAVERWQKRAIWVISRAEPEYPRRLRSLLKEDAPPILYGCGNLADLDSGGLVVVGSRNVDDDLLVYAKGIGRLAAQANKTVISGGARGIDQEAMVSTLEAGGKVIGVLSDSLEKTALSHIYRDFIKNEQLVLISPYDPNSGFNVGNAMQRNKYIYALADRALIVNADFNKGGTWAGAVEQLDKLRFIPIYVRSTGKPSIGLEALQRKGSIPWANPETPSDLYQILTSDPSRPAQEQLAIFSFRLEDENPSPKVAKSIIPEKTTSESTAQVALIPADELFAKVRELLLQMKTPKTGAEVADELRISQHQATAWLQQLVQEGTLKKYNKPVRYGPNIQSSLLK